MKPRLIALITCLAIGCAVIGLATAGAATVNQYIGTVANDDETGVFFQVRRGDNGNKRVRMISTNPKITCEGEGQGQIPLLAEGALKVRDSGRFGGSLPVIRIEIRSSAARGVPIQDGTIRFRGRLLPGGKARGTLNVRLDFAPIRARGVLEPLRQCYSGTVGWRAHVDNI